MKRPSKKKNQNAVDNIAADDRNLIDTEESVELSIEDKISLYWAENKSFIAGSLAVLVLLLVGINGVKMYAAGKRIDLQNTYITAAAEGTLDEFARENSGSALGGFAALTQADAAYSEGSFERAGDLYELALQGLEESILFGRARLGQAFAAYQNGSSEEGVALLNAIHSDASLPSAILAESAYHLAVHAYAEEDFATFQSFASRIKTLDESGQWQRRIATYEQLASFGDAKR
ncbi:MAG: hypothetical protein ACON39_08205 [Coraliomargaritaceae bacterium]